MRELWGEPLAKDSDRVMRPFMFDGARCIGNLSDSMQKFCSVVIC